MNVHRFDEFVADHFLEYVEKTGDQDGADRKTNDFGFLIHTYINSPLCYDGFLNDMDGMRPYAFYNLFDVLEKMADHHDPKNLSGVKVILNMLPDTVLSQDLQDIVSWANLLSWSINHFRGLSVDWYCQEFKEFASQCNGDEKSLFCAIASRMNETAVRKVRGEIY